MLTRFSLNFQNSETEPLIYICLYTINTNEVTLTSLSYLKRLTFRDEICLSSDSHCILLLSRGRHLYPIQFYAFTLSCGKSIPVMSIRLLDINFSSLLHKKCSKMHVKILEDGKVWRFSCRLVWAVGLTLQINLCITVLPNIRQKSQARSKTTKTCDKRPSRVTSLGQYLLEIQWDAVLSQSESCDDKLAEITRV